MKKITLLFLMCFSSFLGFAQVALNEGFDSTANPSGGTWVLNSGTWAIFDNGVGTQGSWAPTSSPTLVHQGTRSVQMNGTNDNLGIGNTSQDWMVTPAVTVPTNGQLKFFTRLQTAGNQGSIFQIRVSTTSQTDVSTFTVLQEWNELTLMGTFNTYEEKTVPLNLPAGSTVYVAFVMLNTQISNTVSSERWLVDTVNILEQCVDPTNLGTGAVTPTSASLTWGNPGGATEWEIEIVSQATPAPTGHGIIYTGLPPYASTGTATGSPLQQVPYISGEDYKYYVRAICSSVGTTSNWVGPFSFSISAIGETCSSAIQITSLPFSTTDDTSNYADTIEGTPGTSCNVTSSYLNGDDVFYAYTATETGVISISMTPTATYSGIFVYNGCSNVGVSCIAGVGNSGTGIREIPSLAVTAGQTYIIVISTWAAPQSTPYTLIIQKVNCTPPTGLAASNISTTAATLSWANPGNLASSWQVDVQTAGTPIPSGAGVTTTNNAAYPAGGLLASTAYRFYVRADCGDGTFSTWAGPFLFNTQCASFNVPFFEGFNSTSPTQFCWTVLNLNGDTDAWNMDYATNPFEGNQSAVILTDGNAGNNNDWLVSPTINLTGNQRLKYHYRVQSVGEPDAFEVKLSTTGVGQANFTTILVPLATYNNITYVERIVNMNGITGPVNIAWHVPQGGPDGWRLYIDNVIVEDIPSCPVPFNLTATNFNTNSAQLSWTAGNVETQWQVVVQAPGTGVPAATAGGTPVGNNYVATTTAAGVPLTAATQYEYYVRAYCAADDVSLWVGPFLFNTAICDLVNQCNYKFVMTDSFGDGWNGNTMSIRQNGIVVATIGSTFTTGAGPITINVPLCNGIPFELFWNSGGSFAGEVGIQVIDAFEEDVYTKLPGQGTANSLLYTGLVDCTPPTCPKPQNLTVTNIGLTNAVLNWTEMGSATSWEVIYQPAGSNTPTGTSVIVTTAPPYTLEGLTSGTAYSFFIRALCSTTDLSNWSGPRNFATAIANDDCANATVVPVNPDLNCTQVVSGILIGATASPEANTCFGNDDDDVWFEFVATATSHLISLNNVAGSTTDLFHVLYQGDVCGSLTQIYCSDPNTSQANGLTIGNTYKIRVYSYSSTPQTTSFDVCVRTPVPPIAVNGTQYTIEQLVQEVLIGSECAIVTNVTSRTGTNFGQSNGIGYFEQNGSSFPFANGVVLSTGNISEAEGPYPGDNTGTESSTWLGDADLNALIVPGGNTAGLNNASVLEFDFVPLTDEISFDFLFASSEYGTFQCSYSDAFAFILTGADGVSQNLAVIPGTTTPVSVVNIRDAQYNSGCASANVEYFGQYNVNDPEASAIGYGGQTVVMTAQSPVNIGETYHIKLVIADYNDSSFNSAVFLAGGSFNIGDINLGVDLTVAGGNAVCGGEPFTITSGLDPNDYDFVWTDENGVVIPNENGPNLTVTQTGTYTLAAAFSGSTCAVSASVRIEFYDVVEIVTGVPNDLTECDPDGFATFDLSENTSVLLTGLNAADYDVTYHATQADADANVNPLLLSFENTVQFIQPIFVRIYNNVTECSGSKTFNLVVQDLSPEFTLTSDFSLCEGTSGTITVTPSNFNVADVTFTWTLDGATTLPDTGSSITVSDEGYYEVTINNNGCSVTDGTAVLVVPIPVAVAPLSSTNCESYVLPVLAEGNYFTATGGTGTQLAPGSLITQTQTIFVYAQSGTTPNCTDEESFVVIIIPALQASVNGSCEGSNYVMEVLPIESSFDPATVSYAWALASAPGTVLGTGQTLTVTEAGSYIVTVTTAGAIACSETFEFTANGTTCMIPKGISPNGDGKNDTFDLTGLQVRKISIFNRYGTIVYDYSNYTDQWHGQSNKGDELPDGTYYYSFEREGGESKTGWVYINRQRN